MALRAILLSAYFVVSLPICFVRPFYGILLWAIVAFLNPQAYTWGGAEDLPWALMVAIPTLLGFVAFSRGWLSRLASRECILIALLWIWFTITTLISTSTAEFFHHAPETWYRWDFVSKVLLMTVVTILVVDSFERLRILAITIAACFGVFVVRALPFVILTGGKDRLYGPENSMIADNNDLGLALNMTLPLFFFLAQTESNRWVKRLFGVLTVITIPAIFATYSRGALVGLVVVLGCMFLQYKRRLILAPIIVMSVLIALLFAPDSWKQRMDPNGEVVDASAKERLNAWTFSWRLASDYPITGGGFATFSQELFDRYAPNPRDVHGPHSIYFGVLAEHGFIGLGLYLSLVLSSLLSVRRIMKLGRYHGDQTALHYANMFRFSLLGFLTSGMFLGRAYFDYYFMVVACIAILKRVCRLRWSESDSGQSLTEAAEQMA